ncbi:DUF2059 domain-containing protein [Pseudooceanicola sp. LIPI14-2-Ac024]|uniref:DUF2059 domain-containing protein n=1 Tax=Pseudooceanicola sp. LIPI14-2-Ac024 TaxID=3344875 RepID=UPI0035CFF3D2
MHLVRKLFTLVPTTILALTTAVALHAADRDRVEAFLNVTGFDVALESIKLSAADAPAMIGLDARDFGASWTRLSNQVFDVPTMQEMGSEILQETLSDEALAFAAAFYASDLGQKLVAAENESHLANRTDKRAVGEAIVEDLKANDPERIALFDRMNRAIGSAELAMKSSNEVQIRFLTAAANAGIIELKTDEEGLRAMQAERAEEILASIRESSLRGAAATYRDFTNEEIEAYAEALEDPLMQEVYELMDAVQFEIMANRFEVLAGQMRGLDPGQEL